MRLIAGLGNPGSAYSNTYHNIGFITLDRLALELKTQFKSENKFNGQLGSGSLDNNSFYLFKPESFMNLSGSAISKVMHFYKIKLTDLLVVYDDIDMELAKIRYKKDGSHGGHNGVRNIIDQMASTNFAKLKIGIGRGLINNTSDFVLSKINSNDKISLDNAIVKAIGYIKDFIMGYEIKVIN